MQHVAVTREKRENRLLRNVPFNVKGEVDSSADNSKEMLLIENPDDAEEHWDRSPRLGPLVSPGVGSIGSPGFDYAASSETKSDPARSHRSTSGLSVNSHDGIGMDIQAGLDSQTLDLDNLLHSEGPAELHRGFSHTEEVMPKIG